MRKFFTLLFTITTILVSAQIFNPVSWEFSQNQLSENQVELIFKASIDEHWHLYSQKEIEGGNLPTEIIFDSIAQTKDFKLIGKPVES